MSVKAILIAAATLRVAAASSGGLWLDDELNTEPLFVLLGLVLGLTVAAWGTYRLLRDVLRAGRGS